MPDYPVNQYQNRVIVIIQEMDVRVIHALKYAASLSADITAFGIAVCEDEEQNLHAQWSSMNACVPLVTRISAVGGIAGPLMEFIKSSDISEGMITVVFPQIVARNKWQSLQQYSVAKYLQRKLSKHGEIVLMILPVPAEADVIADSSVGLAR